MTAPDFVVLLFYVVTIVVAGVLLRRRALSPEAYMLANRRLPGWLLGLSIFGTYLSSISFLALPGKAYAAEWSPLAFSLSLPLAAWIAGRWFAPLYRAAPEASAYAYLERRFGLWARLYCASFYLLTQIARMATILFLIALALDRLLGWDIVLIIVATGILATFYSAVGGIEAVIWTDAIQSVVLTVGAVVCAALLLFGMPGGPGQLFDIAFAHDKFSLGTFAPVLTEAGFWVVFLYGLTINLQNFGIDQSYVQRYKSAASLPAARQSVWIGALLYLPVGALFLFIGTALFAYYAAQPGLLPPELQTPDLADRVFPYFIVSALPPGVTGLMIAALFAAAMSSLDTSLNSSATVLTTDFYLRARPGVCERTQLRFLRITTVLLGALGTAAALFMLTVKGMLDVWWNLAGIFSGGMLGLFLLGMLSRRARSMQAGIAMIVGILVLIWAGFSTTLDLPVPNPLHPFMTTVLATLAIFATGIVVSRHHARQPQPMKSTAGS